VLFSLYLLYLYHAWKSRGDHALPPPTPATRCRHSWLRTGKSSSTHHNYLFVLTIFVVFALIRSSIRNSLNIHRKQSNIPGFLRHQSNLYVQEGVLKLYRFISGELNNITLFLFLLPELTDLIISSNFSKFVHE